MADKLVYWRYGDKSDYWHLYPDCKDLNGALLDGTLCKGKPEVAYNTGREKVCPLCKERSDREYWKEQEQKKNTEQDSEAFARKQISVQQQICPKPPKMMQQDTAIFYMLLFAALSGSVCWLAASARTESQEPNSDGYVTEHYLELQKQASYEEGYAAGKADAQSAVSQSEPKNAPLANPESTSSATSGQFKVTASARMIYNNHVGDDWEYYFEANNQSLPDTLYCHVGDNVPIYAEITEDDTIPDVGSWDGYVTIEDGDFEDGFNASADVYVYETSGKYAGNSAKFEVTWNFQPR